MNAIRGSGAAGQLMDEEGGLSLVELCRVCRVPSDLVIALIDEGAVEPLGSEPPLWRFAAQSVRRVRLAASLKRDLGVNVAGVAVAIELIEELEITRARLLELDRTA